MSAIGTKRTSELTPLMSAFGGKADITFLRPNESALGDLDFRSPPQCFGQQTDRFYGAMQRRFRDTRYRSNAKRVRLHP